MAEQLFQFQPRWKEELVVSGSGGSFLLELSMGVLSAHLPTEAEWKQRAPVWAQALWPELKQELEDWCCKNKVKFYIVPLAYVYPL